MNFLRKLDNFSKTTWGLALSIGIAAYMVIEAFYRVNLTELNLGMFLQLFGVVAVIILLELKGEQLFSTIILLLYSRIGTGMFIDSPVVFLNYLNYNQVDIFILLNLLIGIYLLLRLFASFFAGRRVNFNMPNKWYSLLIFYTIVLYFNYQFSSMLILMIPVLLGFLVREEKLTLILMILILVPTVYISLYSLINGIAGANNLMTIIIDVLIVVYIGFHFRIADDNNKAFYN